MLCRLTARGRTGAALASVGMVWCVRTAPPLRAAGAEAAAEPASAVRVTRMMAMSWRIAEPPRGDGCVRRFHRSPNDLPRAVEDGVKGTPGRAGRARAPME